MVQVAGQEVTYDPLMMSGFLMPNAGCVHLASVRMAVAREEGLSYTTLGRSFITEDRMGATVLVIDGGARGHALIWRLAQSPKVSRIFAYPGNGGTVGLAENAPGGACDAATLCKFASDHAVDLTIVGPERLLADGIVDRFRKAGLRIFGPTRAAARIETSKRFAKRLMSEMRIPTAAFRTFREYGAARSYVRTHGVPLVIKADGLSAGKGVFVCMTIDDAERALADIMISRTFGSAGDTVVIEEFLDGPEMSVHAFCDGKTALLLPGVRDHKAVHDGGKGSNTGGMGTYGPVPAGDKGFMDRVRTAIVDAALQGLERRGIGFTGCLFPGLKLTDDGPKVLEFNARPGDPETQVYMRLLASDAYGLFLACADGTLADYEIGWHAGSAVCVVLASHGYPGPYATGIPIYGVASAEQVPGVAVFHAGTRIHEGQLLTAGGRVLSVTAYADDLKTVRAHAYAAVRCIRFEGMHYRSDIGSSDV